MNNACKLETTHRAGTLQVLPSLTAAAEKSTPQQPVATRPYRGLFLVKGNRAEMATVEHAPMAQNTQAHASRIVAFVEQRYQNRVLPQPVVCSPERSWFSRLLARF